MPEALPLAKASVPFETETVGLPHMARQSETTSLDERRKLGSVRGLFPVLRVGAAAALLSLAGLGGAQAQDGKKDLPPPM